MNGQSNLTGVRGWVLYDDSCGFCRWWVPYWRTTLIRRGFEIAPLQDDWVRSHFDLPHDELVGDLRLLINDGSTAQGADVYRYILRRIWWSSPLFAFAVCPGTRSLFDLGYRWFARNRFRVSATCRLPAGPVAR